MWIAATRKVGDVVAEGGVEKQAVLRFPFMFWGIPEWMLGSINSWKVQRWLFPSASGLTQTFGPGANRATSFVGLGAYCISAIPWLEGGGQRGKHFSHVQGKHFLRADSGTWEGGIRLG